jgi:enhancing lycopene biosynthesis protein 2
MKDTGFRDSNGAPVSVGDEVSVKTYTCDTCGEPKGFLCISVVSGNMVCMKCKDKEIASVRGEAVEVSHKTKEKINHQLDNLVIAADYIEDPTIKQCVSDYAERIRKLLQEV